MQSIFAEMKFMFIQIVPDKKADPADGNQSHNSKQDDRMTAVSGK